MDADVIFLGYVLDRLNAVESEFIVSGSTDIHDPMDPHVQALYYDFKRIKEFDPSFEWPGYVFNAGQFVFTAGTVPLSRLGSVFDMSAKPFTRIEGLKLLDQGGLNYLLPKLAQEELITVSSVPFKSFASRNNRSFMELSFSIIRERGYPIVAHWAGPKNGLLSKFPRGEILVYFNDYYHAKLPLGELRKFLSGTNRYMRWLRFCLVQKFKVFGIRTLRVFGLRQ
jgi:hypothetical protein